MLFSNRLEELGQAVFQRNDFLKTSYREYSSKADQFPLIDLSLGSSDLLPPENVIKVMKDSLADLESSSYSLHTSTKPFREAAAIWCKKRLGVNVDPDREVLFLVGSQEGSAHLPLAITDPGDTGLILDPYFSATKIKWILDNNKKYISNNHLLFGTRCFQT